MKKGILVKGFLYAILLLLFMPFVETQATSLPDRINIDEPSSYNVSGSTMLVRGWALDSSGVKSVKVYIDGKAKSTAAIGLARYDVAKVYPEYTGGTKSGFSSNVSLSGIAIGNHTLKVVATGNDGSVQWSTKSIKIVKQTNIVGLAAIGSIDEPASNATIKADFKVRGWALNGSGIKSVAVYVNNVLKGNASIGKLRTDVKAAFPQYNQNYSGYELNIDYDALSAGSQQVKVVATGNDGTKQIMTKTINVVKLAAIGSIDEPTGSGTIIADFTVRGWALNASGVKSVGVYVDNVFKVNATLGKSRPDVQSAYPQYSQGNSGFEAKLDQDSLTAGKHLIKVVAVGNNGTTKTITRYITVEKLSNIGCIDSPSNGEMLTSDFTLRGWALNASGVKSVAVYIDSTFKGYASKGKSRADVKAIYPKYNDSNSGFEYNVDYDALKLGSHQIKIIITGNNGTKQTLYRNFVIANLIMNVKYDNTLDYYVNQQITKGAPVVYNSSSDLRSANADEVKYYMNSANFANDDYGKYMFMKLSYTSGITAAQLNKVLEGKGILSGKGDVFLKAGQTYNVNPIYLVAHALLETGNGTSSLSNGITVDQLHSKVGDEAIYECSVIPTVTYNVYGIGAYDGNANMWGSERAYREGWFSIDSAIIGGAKWVGSSYINNETYKQDTLYKMRWNLEVTSHQYATDIGWAYKQIKRIKELVDTMDNPKLFFEVPTFN